ncbi:uncharacterized protein LOC119649438 [Hermetia illucens]|uniref:uncharacterized protein LOC119649438 n=1 Tax=Hermetia illucens TaxID=343691 RepID=UPI0018CC5961|nr:uncharacterized protein LOC119649438 [Hermetia illucens]
MSGMREVAVRLIVLWLLHRQTNEVIGAIRGCPTISGVICIDQSTFGLCDTDGFLTETRFNCAIGSICTEKSPEICKPLYKAAPPSCDKNCGKCNKSKGFACVGKSKFAICSDGNYPGGIIYSCPRNTVCSTSGKVDTGESKLTEFCYDELKVPKPDCC